MDKIKTLSQAIKIGCLAHPKCFDELYLANINGQIVRTCVLGAGLAASGFDLTKVKLPLKTLSKRFSVPELILDEAVVKNDSRHWSRERIAIWLEKQGY